MGGREEELRGRLRGIGFDEVRFVGLAPRVGGDGLQAWLEAGYHGEMDWMEKTAAKRLDPGLVLQGARSAILLGVNYFDGGPGRMGDVNARQTPVWALSLIHI